MYWTELVDVDFRQIRRADLDGSNVDEIVPTGLVTPLEIALDIAGGEIYWTDGGANKILRADMDGSDVEDVIATGLVSPRGIALDIPPPGPVPTMSEWGMLAMTVILLASGGIVLRRSIRAG